MSKLSDIILNLNKIIDDLERATGVPAVEVKKQKQPQKAPEKVELPPLVACLAKCEIRVTQIISCERVDFSDKLLKMTLKINENGETRAFAAGIAAFYSPEQLLNKKIITILNLKERPMAEGRIVSQAMLFAGSNADHSVVRVCFPDQSLPLGTRVTVEGVELPEPEGQPKKNFDKVGEALVSKSQQVFMGEFQLLAGGKPISVDIEDGSHIG